MPIKRIKKKLVYDITECLMVLTVSQAVFIQITGIEERYNMCVYQEFPSSYKHEMKRKSVKSSSPPMCIEITNFTSFSLIKFSTIIWIILHQNMLTLSYWAYTMNI